MRREWPSRRLDLHGRCDLRVVQDLHDFAERGVKGFSPRYRALFCQLSGVAADQLGCGSTVLAAPSRPVRDAESLVSMFDNAASLLDQLGAVGTVLAPQMLAAWKDTVTSRRTMLGLLDPAATDPAGHARAATAMITDLEQLAERYQALHATADPAALLTPVAAHVRMATAALGCDHTASERRRLLRNLATVAALAGCLAYEDLGDAASGRAYYSLAAALDQAPHTARRTRIFALTDLATVELHAGKLPETCRNATTAADLLHRTPDAAGVARLRGFRTMATRPLGPRALDDHLSRIAA